MSYEASLTYGTLRPRGNNSAMETPNACASLAMLYSEIFRNPRSIPPM